MHGHVFKADLRVIWLEGSRMVLGIDWLKSYSEILFDFQQNSITITKDGHPLVLKGISEGAKLRLITANQWYQESQFGRCCVLTHCPEEEERETEILHKLQQILD